VRAWASKAIEHEHNGPAEDTEHSAENGLFGQDHQHMLPGPSPMLRIRPAARSTERKGSLLPPSTQSCSNARRQAQSTGVDEKEYRSRVRRCDHRSDQHASTKLKLSVMR
jgi:hypothetical protein